MRTIILPIVLLVVILLALIVPWYPTVRRETATSTFTFTYSYELPTQSYRQDVLYTLQAPVLLHGLFESGISLSTLASVFQNLGDTPTVDTGAIVHVTVTECQSCSVSISEDFGRKLSVLTVTGSGSGDFAVVDPGQYKIAISNLGNTSDYVQVLTITASTPVQQVYIETETGYNTVSVDHYSVASTQPFQLIGTITSIIVLVILTIIVAFSALFDFGIIRFSTRRRRR